MATDVAWLVCVNIIKDSRYMLACEMAVYSLLTNRPHTHAHLIVMQYLSSECA